MQKNNNNNNVYLIKLTLNNEWPFKFRCPTSNCILEALKFLSGTLCITRLYRGWQSMINCISVPLIETAILCHLLSANRYGNDSICTINSSLGPTYE